MTVLQSQQMVNSTLSNLSELHLPQIWEKKVAQIIHENRMLYEPRIETARSYNELKDRLRERGFVDVPNGASPLLHLKAYSRAPVADTSAFHIRKTMTRRKK